jgi:hypothetical protein
MAEYQAFFTLFPLMWVYQYRQALLGEVRNPALLRPDSDILSVQDNIKTQGMTPMQSYEQMQKTIDKLQSALNREIAYTRKVNDRYERMREQPLTVQRHVRSVS